MEQRLIDANALKKAVNGRSTHWLNAWSTLGVLAIIDEQPTVDAVPVVRCVNCKYCYAEGFVNVRNVCEKHYDFGNVDDDWFCADGERKSND